MINYYYLIHICNLNFRFLLYKRHYVLYMCVKLYAAINLVDSRNNYIEPRYYVSHFISIFIVS